MCRKKNKKRKKVFEDIYISNGFEGDDSVSGPGSDLQQTLVIRDTLPKLLQELKSKILLDIPCGDFYWMNQTNLNGVKYIGADIVDNLVKINNEKFGNENTEFIVLDLIRDPLPNADILLCRDCLVHLCYNDIKKALINIKLSSIQYLLTTTFPDRRENSDIRTGQWRPLNLTLPPFNLPAPLILINEGCSENYMQFKDKSLGLWKLDDLVDFNYERV